MPGPSSALIVAFVLASVCGPAQAALAATTDAAAAANVKAVPVRGETAGSLQDDGNDVAFWLNPVDSTRSLIQALSGAGPVTIREAARRVGRDVKAVHSDVQTLLACGVLDKTEDGKIQLPYDAVHVDFMLKAA